MRAVPSLLARAVLATLVGLAALSAATATARAATSFPVRVTETAISQPIRAGFVGLAIEYNEVPELAGASASSVNPVFVQLLQNLDPGGHALLRIGGQSTDRSWWPVAGMTRPLGITYELTPSWASDARALAQATGAQLMLGIELEADSRRIAQVESRELVKRIGRRHIAALEIGNEPELYRSIPWYKQLGGQSLAWSSTEGVPVFNRPPSYGPNAFVSQFKSIVGVLPAVPVAGPAGGGPSWLKAFAPLIRRASRVSIVTTHAYALVACTSAPSSPIYPSVPNLLSEWASRHLADGLSPYVALAHEAGASFRIDELGSVACNGRPGVSNTFASALWLLDTLFDFAANDVDGVNIHTYPGISNNLFDFSLVNGRRTADVHPLYYGALMFAQAAPSGSKLLKLDAGSQSKVRVWATRASDGQVRVLLLNDSTSTSVQARVNSPEATGPARVERLQASSAYATSGVELGGQSFGTATSTGLLPTPRLQAVTPRKRVYTVTLPAASAVLLTLPTPRAAPGHIRLPLIASGLVMLLLAGTSRWPRWPHRKRTANRMKSARTARQEY